MSETFFQVEDGWIETFTGRAFHFGDPKISEFDIEDIAHALSMLCRYNGHCNTFYSVAEHSYLMAYWLIRNGYSIELAFTGLMHDVAEAYIGDMPRPIKHKLSQFKELETIIERAAARRFGFMYPFPPIIKELDVRILSDERPQIMGPSANQWMSDDLLPLGVVVEGWSPDESKQNFLKIFHELDQ